MTHCQLEHVFIMLIALFCIGTGIWAACNPIREWTREREDEY